VKYEIIDFLQPENPEMLMFRLRASENEYVEILNLGGIVHSWFCRDRDGYIDDILLGCRQVSEYTQRHPYFNSVVGRYANRIGSGTFRIGDRFYSLNKNLPPHHLHGGEVGFDRKFYEHHIEVGEDRIILTLSAVSESMEEGYPGDLRFSVIYTYDNFNRLSITYRAETSAPTHVNLTHHFYFNLCGQACPDVRRHEVRIHASSYTQADKTLLPTGKILTVGGTPFDLRNYRCIGEIFDHHQEWVRQAKGFDLNYVLDRPGFDKPVAEVRDIGSGRELRVYTDQPGLQFYTGNWLDGIPGKTGVYKDYAGLCLETQHFPDTPNRPEFPSTLLLPGEIYTTTTVYETGILSADRG
jgi:aldose 1-epimerase